MPPEGGTANLTVPQLVLIGRLIWISEIQDFPVGPILFQPFYETAGHD
jgi:hypothetical protein